MKRLWPLLRVAWLMALLPAAVACERPSSWADKQIDRSSLEIVDQTMRIRHDVVGSGKHEYRATFVMVDVENHTDRDAMVTLGGELLDANGATVGTLRSESLRVPAGGVRLFTPVDEQDSEHPTAVGARLQVLGAFEPDYQPPLVVTDGHIFKVRDRVVVSGYLVNTAPRQAKVIVLAGFYDEQGRPMTRPHSVLVVQGNSKVPVEMTGPKGSAKGYIFVGDMVY